MRRPKIETVLIKIEKTLKEPIKNLVTNENWDCDRTLRSDEVRHQPKVAVRRNERQDPFRLKKIQKYKNTKI